MAKNKFSSAFAFIGILALLLVFGCTQANPQNGTLQGHITIGPLCPVETNPPAPNCLPTEQTYAAYPFEVLKVNPQTNALEKITTFTGDNEGNYKIELLEGNYELSQDTGLSVYQH